MKQHLFLLIIFVEENFIFGLQQMAHFDKFGQCFLIWMSLALDELKLGLLDYDKNHNHNYFGQYCNHDYLKQLLVGHMTNYMKDLFKDSDIYQIYIFCK